MVHTYKASGLILWQQVDVDDNYGPTVASMPHSPASPKSA